MQNGFVIIGNELAQAPLKATEVKTNILKKHYVSIIVSVLVHLLLAFLLFFIAEKQQITQEKVTKKAIKSYLYKMPAKRTEIKPIKEEVNVKEKLVELKQDLPKEIQVETQIKIEKKQSEVKPEISSTSATPATQVKSPSNEQKPAQANFSAYKQLDSLRNSINEKIMAQELSELQKFRSPSVMHGEQIPVPHSNMQLTPEQDLEKKTTKMSNDISITKYDNGICTIEREQFLGSPVEGSSSAFSCGESQFDKNFREHMKKVQEKIMPQR